MFGWAMLFLVVAIIAAILGFGVIAGTIALIAKVLFFMFLVMFAAAILLDRRIITS